MTHRIPHVLVLALIVLLAGNSAQAGEETQDTVGHVMDNYLVRGDFLLGLFLNITGGYPDNRLSCHKLGLSLSIFPPHDNNTDLSHNL
jgi:hypothetical protein